MNFCEPLRVLQYIQNILDVFNRSQYEVLRVIRIVQLINTNPPPTPIVEMRMKCVKEVVHTRHAAEQTRYWAAGTVILWKAFRESGRVQNVCGYSGPCVFFKFQK